MTTARTHELLESGSARDTRRRVWDRFMRVTALAATILAIIPLIALIYFVTTRAIPWLDAALFVNNPLDKPSGISNAIFGSLQLTTAAILAVTPIGVLAAIYLNEYASPRVVSWSELVIDVMLGVPSIVVGMFAFMVIVPQLGVSAGSGVVAIGILMLPIVVRTTQEVLRLVPASVREASLALGIPVWKTTLFIVCRTAFSGILTAVILAYSRGLGETAPLLLTVRGTFAQNWLDFGTTMNAMPLTIYSYSGAADSRTIGQAWAAALLLMVMALVLNIIVRARTVNSRVA